MQGWSLGVRRSLLPIVQVAIIKRHLALLAFLVKDHRVKAEKPVTEGRGGFNYGLRAAQRKLYLTDSTPLGMDYNLPFRAIVKWQTQTFLMRKCLVLRHC